jgi:hypothetical protein
MKPREGLPWEHRQTKGFFNAFVETLIMVLTKPVEAFTVMKREGGLIEPLLYQIIGGSFGILVYFLFGLAMPSMAAFGSRNNPLLHLFGVGVGAIFAIICVPIVITIGVFIWSGILHLCLMMVGGATRPFETTFRVVCFAGGSCEPIIALPFCGGVIAGVWRIVATCIGIARAHETETGRAVLAVFLPLIICCGGMVFFFVVFGGISAFSHHGTQ